jgi:hydroxyquinol 1,2-dioxygenase
MIQFFYHFYRFLVLLTVTPLNTQDSAPSMRLPPQQSVTVGVDASTVTTAVMDSFVHASNSRLVELLPLLVKHLHAFIKEGKVSQEEWRMGLEFLTESAAITTQERNEFILLSDILGVSSLVDLQSQSGTGTPGSVLGPFHNHDSLWLENGADLIQGQTGEPVLLLGRVVDDKGRAAEDACIDFWQNADNALYPAQDPSQHAQNLRCKIKCDENGRFALRTIVPKPYTVPYDGPVGKMLLASNRHCWRPAHFHLVVVASGCRSLVTEIFPEGGQYLESDAVFGVREGLTIPMPECNDETLARTYGIARPFRLAQFEICLTSNLTKHE